MANNSRDGRYRRAEPHNPRRIEDCVYFRLNQDEICSCDYMQVGACALSRMSTHVKGCLLRPRLHVTICFRCVLVLRQICIQAPS